jgi:alpha-galactosidase
LAQPASATGVTLAWQIEHNGAWHWEIGECPDWTCGVPPPEDRICTPDPAGPPRLAHSHDGAYLALSGPTDDEHQWWFELAPGESFTSVPVTLTAGPTLEDALGNLTTFRRAARRPHRQNESLPVVFNDYMNTLEGDPTEAKLLPLIDAARQVGAQYFCIDAGWYDDTAGWWASVGDWRPSTVRFEHGLEYLTEHIRASGMVPGLWLEPEVVGVTSRAADELPAAAFLSRRGRRIREQDRNFLDFRNPAARAHVDAAIDRLIGNLGIGYFKFDHNVTPGSGTDVNSASVGHGLLEHNRAVVTWLNAVLDRHPDLIIENCASGSMRSDFAMLGTLQLQSTSDQQLPLLYPAIAVGALAHILPEQAGNWAYPQPDMSDEEIVFVMMAGLAGRLYLSGVLSGMDQHRLALVRSAVAAHNATKATIARSTPRFPTGLPSWDHPWVSVAFDAEDDPDPQTLLVMWQIASTGREITVSLPHLGGRTPSVEQVFPPRDVGAEWAVTTRVDSVTVSLPPTLVPSSRMFRLRHS